jgi:hypothetical protein
VEIDMTPGAVEIDVRYDRGSQAELAKQTLDLSAQLTCSVIVDQSSLNAAGEVIRAADQWLKSVDRIMDPVRDATHKAWKAAIAAQDEFKAPVEKPLKALKAACAKFVADAKAETERKQHEADELQRKENEAEARRVAAQFRDVGATKAEINEIKQEILAKPAEEVKPIVEAPTGMSGRMLYSAEVVDMAAFIKHLAQDNFLLTLFAYNAVFKKAIESELRGLASDRKDKYDIPGTKLVKTASGSWRG